jgi:hypothetical protein
MYHFNTNQTNEIELNKLNKNTHVKRVQFLNTINVVYIPKYNEICDCRDLWWSELDKKIAMIFMNNEINTLLRIHPSMNTKQAMKLLYQPNNLRFYDPTNFV